MEVPTPQELHALNNQLLKDNDPPEAEARPKRNSKSQLIKKLIDLCEEQGLELEESDTKLRRMTKPDLNALLARKAEEAMKRQMADTVGVQSGACDPVIALGALRMVHDIMAGVAERGMDVVLPKYGYECKGFVQSLHQPAVRDATDACLREIAAETDVLKYVQSPFARLGLAWAGCLVTCVRKKTQNGVKEHASGMGPRPARRQNPVQPSVNWGAPDGKKHGGDVPFKFDEKPV